jgi:hypothetical protein
MYEKEFTEHQNRIASAGSRSEERKMALQTGVEFADDAVERLDADEEHAAGEFRRRKASWKRHVSNDEKPREIQEQMLASRIFRIAGFCAIGIEVGIATYTLHQLFLAYALPFAAALALALVLAVLVTLPIAYLFHGAIYYLVTRLSEPAAQLKRLTVYFVGLPLLFVALSIVAYVAVFRLDAETVYALQGVLSAMKFVAMFGFMILGAALLVAADLYGWSHSRAVNYKAIMDERLALAGKHREWQNELAALSGQQPAGPQQAQQTPPPTTSPNGNSAGATTAATTVISALLILGALGGLSACTPPAPKVKMVPVQDEVVCDVVIDASGDPDGSEQQQQGELRQRALRQAGLNLIESVKKTVEREHVTKLNVFWLGDNGWTLEEKLTLAIPPYKRVELVRREAGEFDKLRPDVADVERQRNEKALAEATAQTSSEYHSDVEKALARFNVEAIVPPPTAGSPCTDLNGMMARFSELTSAARRVLYVVTDGRESCGGEAGIQKVAFPENTAVVIVLIPGVDADGRDDFEQRRVAFTDACARCEVVPFFMTDIDSVAGEFFKKRDAPSSLVKK